MSWGSRRLPALSSSLREGGGADEGVRPYTKNKGGSQAALANRKSIYSIFTLATLMESFPIVPVTAT
jgi:hypothetical protein